MKQRTRNNRDGFTLVETIVAITILTLALTGPLMIAQRSLKATLDARNRITATYLADEGVEILRSIRDNNSARDPSLDRNGWLDGRDGSNNFSGGIDLMGECGNTHSCVIDVSQIDTDKAIYKPNAIIRCPAGVCGGDDIVYQDTTSGIYGQFDAPPLSPWTKTVFTRTMRVTGIDNVVSPMRQARITATVSFRGVGGVQTVTVAEDVYNWFPKLPNNP